MIDSRLSSGLPPTSWTPWLKNLDEIAAGIPYGYRSGPALVGVVEKVTTPFRQPLVFLCDVRDPPMVSTECPRRGAFWLRHQFQNAEVQGSALSVGNLRNDNFFAPQSHWLK